MVPAPQPADVVRFGVFEADVCSGELRKNGVRVKIQDLPFRALKLFVSKPNQILSRDEFRQALWPENVFVDFDHGISSAINRLRDALGDSADNPLFIETLDRRGYRWIAPTHVPAPVVPAGPKLIHSVAVPPAATPTVPVLPGNSTVSKPSLLTFQRAWVFALPTFVLLVAAWGFKPVYRATKAAVNKPHAISQAAASDRPATEAQELYLKGRFYWNKRTPDDLNKAVDFFTQSIIHDPSYAPAYVGLADCYNLLREYTLMPASEAYPRALAAAKRAVELDDQSSEAHASLAFGLFWGNWDATNAEREFRRAIELNPHNAVAHHWYATFLGTAGRHQEALAEIERAQTLDPASKSILADKGQILAGAGRRDEAAALLKQLEATEPDFISPHRYLKEIDFANGVYGSFLAEWKREATLMHDAATLKLIAAAEKGYAFSGARGLLQSMEIQQRELYEEGSLSPYPLAQTEALLGNKQEALRLLAIANQKHDERILAIASDATLDALHEEPGYRDLVARLGFSGEPILKSSR
jgi:DNA-binding winged helix-turn-helix (wHTH) protein/Tfp pilus assembly protein PilF